MKSKKILPGIAGALGMVLLILDSKTALAGAAEGVELCLKAVIPSLFPFLVLSIFLTNTLSGTSHSFLRPLSRLWGIPQGAEPLLLSGLLGGYPVGAQAIAQSWRTGSISRETARRMLGFCSNCGPAFIFGMCGPRFSSPWAGLGLWLIHILGALGAALLLPRQPDTCNSIRSTPMTLSKALEKGCHVMAQICGWVVLFRVVIAVLQRWVLWLVPAEVQVLLIGLLELSNGCCELVQIQNEGLRFIMCACFISTGGLCVAMQTRSVTGSLGMGWYLPGKLLQCAISVLLAAFLQDILVPTGQRFPLPTLFCALLAAIPLSALIILRKKKKYSSIPRALGV